MTFVFDRIFPVFVGVVSLMALLVGIETFVLTIECYNSGDLGSFECSMINHW